jgi:hypothetical protein
MRDRPCGSNSKKNRFKPSKWPYLFTFEFQFEFLLLALFYPHGAFLSESKTPPGVPVRALVIEKRVQKT